MRIGPSVSTISILTGASKRVGGGKKSLGRENPARLELTAAEKKEKEVGREPRFSFNFPLLDDVSTEKKGSKRASRLD